MNRVSALGCLVGCLALVSRGVLVVVPSSALAQEEGQAEAPANADAAEPDSDEEAGGAVAGDPASPLDDDSAEDEPSTGTGTDDQNGNEGVGTDDEASRSPAEAPGSESQGVEAL
jgi:hypothetical protein